MSRLIDADVFMGNIVSIADLRTISTKTIGEALDKTPTVDAVPVALCIDRIQQEIDELKENGRKHSDEVRQNGLLIAEGLRMAVRIIREVEEENDDETNKNNSLVGNRNE